MNWNKLLHNITKQNNSYHINQKLHIIKALLNINKKNIRSRKSFQDTHTHTQLYALQAQTKQNLGHIAFRKAQQLKDQNQQQAIKTLENSITHYKHASYIAPNDQKIKTT